MAAIQSIVDFVDKLKATFLERHEKYGTKGMDVDKAVSLALTKIDRIKNGESKDSALDLAGYAMIIHLLQNGLWDAGAACLRFVRDALAKQHPLPMPRKIGDVGYDMTCTEDVVVPSIMKGGGAVRIPSGLRMKIPTGYWAEIRSRSSAASRGLLVVPCVIDNGYTGPLFSQVINFTGEDIVVKAGERVAQIVIHDSHVPEAMEVDELPETERGATGFGSTGT